MLWITLFLISCSFCNAQDFNNSYEIDETDEETNCIREYIDLEKYIIKNEKLIEKLAETFFTTGRAPSSFVKITYYFQISYIHHDNQSAEDSINNCSNQQSTYLWSTTALYLIGPNALYWCTLFAVNIREVDVTIELPCLCSEVYSNLLSRLTYLVAMFINLKI